ncbi:MAG: dienelactone hydrolase family protein [Acidimicrobiia bacterium]|nr:dienelactone hydrolase family protein [Acidimicrobiia bacterium]
MGMMVEFASNGSTAQGYLAVPESGSGPGVIVIQEWWGLVDHIKSVADRFAANGFVALAPDLYHGEETSEPDEAGKLMMNMELGNAAQDMSGAVDYLLSLDATTGGGVGAVGFCMGGGLVLWLSTIKPEVKACVPFYGAIPWESMQPDYSASVAAYLGHYAEEDTWATQDGARRLAAHLEGLGRNATFHFYEGTDHAFFNDDRPEVYDPEASALAFERTVAFLRSQL